ncbi:MAG TPA: hypothetical protein VNA57_10420 [Acidimicrobiales bacterium]|nr:hypothetical protein [Acidimicrobiales bacterium]
MSERDPEAETEREVREEAAAAEDDPVTRREGMEQDLMAEGESEAGEELGDESP